MVKKSFIAAYLFFLVTACSKNSSYDDDKELPVIQLVTPTNNQVFTSGQTVQITGTITDNGKLAEIHTHIYDNNTAQLLIDINRYPTMSSWALNESFIVQAGIQYKIQIVAKDKSANQQVETVMVSAN